MQSINSHAKFKYLKGEVLNSIGTITNLQIPDAGIEGHMITGNEKFVAIPWKSGGGGCVHVRKIEDSGRVPNMDTPLLLGHKGLIQDLSFSPHNQSLLATASADSTVKLWNIQEDKISQSISDSDGALVGHTKKIVVIQWHPSAAFTLGSASQDGSIKIWDVQKQSCSNEYKQLQGHPWAISWNYDGSLISCISKENKKIHIVDPRQQEAAMIGDAHKGIKAQRIQWGAKSGKIISTGASEYNEREFAVFDPRNISKPLVIKKLDQNTQNFHTYYNDLNNIFYVANKGANTQLFFFNENNSIPEMQPLEGFTCKEPQTYMYFMPRSTVNCWNKEIDRSIRLTKNYVEHIVFKLPLKTDDFQADLYPPHPSCQPSLTHEEWLSGTNNDPILESFDPNNQSKKQLTQKVTFQPNLNVVQKDQISASISQAKNDNSNEKNEKQKQTNNFESDIKSYQNQIKQKDEKIDQMQKKVQNLENQIQQQKEEITNLKQQLQQFQSTQNKPQEIQIKNNINQVNRKNYSKQLPQKPILGYWDIRGLAQGIRYQLIYQGIDFQDKYYEHSEDQASRESWLKEKQDLGLDFPNLPYFVDTDGFTLTESLAIHEYIAQKWMPELLGRTVQERAKVSMISKILMELKFATTMPCFVGNLDELQLESLIYDKIQPISLLMSKNKYSFILGGEELCYMDFFLFELCLFFDFLTQGRIYLKENWITTYMSKFYNHPRLQEFFKNNFQDVQMKPFVMKFALINNWKQILEQQANQYQNYDNEYNNNNYDQNYPDENQEQEFNPYN